ncbi:MAG TPA: DNA-binding domain-containing protein, partial [Polyangiaceae bacterium]|nr:DNA-binding domain-containing protein [Polyangiaceae bacterium]
MTTDSLRALERRFFSLVTRPPRPPGAGGRFATPADADGGEAAVPLERWLLGSPELDAEARLGIYADMYVSRMIDVLAEDYRLGKLLVGAEAFDRLAAEYLARHPSRHPSLRHFGRQMPAFVRSHALGERPGFADLLALEWARSDAFDAPDAEARPWSSFAAIEPAAWPSLRLELVPAARFLRLETSADELWSAL